MNKSHSLKFFFTILFFTIPIVLFSQNLFLNPGFESGGTGWIFTPSNVTLSTEHHGGSVSALMNPTGTDTALLAQCIGGLHSGKTYVFDYWVKADSVRYYMLPFVRFACDTGNVYDSYFCPNGNVPQWQRVSSRILIPPGADSVIFFFALFQKGKVWLDDFSLVELTDTTYHSFSVNLQQTTTPFTDVFNCNGIGPGNPAQTNNHIQKFQDMGMNYVRTHDFAIAFDYHIIFPDTSKSAFDSTAYNFHTTDSCIYDILNAGGKVYFRFGESYELNHDHAYPPANPEKFADVCVQIIKHYNDGWNSGFHYNLDYFEIWNEPDIKDFWSGTVQDYIRMYKAAATKIKQYNNTLNVGGPTVSNVFNETFTNVFLDSIVSASIPLDFFAYHLYYLPNPYYFKIVNDYARAKLDSRGLQNVKLVNSEWNPYLFSFDTYNEWGMDDAMNAASTASALIYLQQTSFDKIFRYALDNWWFGLVDWQDNWRHSGLVFKAFQELTNNATQLQTNGSDTLGTAIVASIQPGGINSDIIVSDNSSSSHGYNLTLAGISMMAVVLVDIFRIDSTHFYDQIGSTMFYTSPIKQNVRAPFCDHIKITIVQGTRSQSEDHSLVLYPNPATDKLFITSEKQSMHQIEIVDLCGSVKLKTEINSMNASLDVSSLPAGFYLARVTDETGNLSQMKITLVK
ncbi:MAG: T9SS type A sorting domain-containing protein [Bacteroidota bacterium]